ncbi:MAG: tetratricopeptide repeat protein [Bacteroidetes bacterium]|nr:MAG: tetratricopeptide repeat protein [Bacteroidota bacterium]
MKNVLKILVVLVSITVLYGQSSYEKIRDLVYAGDYMNAAALIPAAVKENPKNEALMILCGDVYSELDKLDSALIMYKKADDIKSDEPPTMRKIAQTLSLLGRHNEAINEMKDAIKEAPNDVQNYLEIGRVYIKADSLKLAEFNISKAREINKSIPDAYVALGDLYFAQKVYELAKNNYEEALSINQDLIDARIKLATAYYWLGMRELDKDLANEFFERSLKEWNTITKKDPKNAKAYFEQGKILYFSQQFENAAKSLYEYVTLRPTGSLGRWYLAQSLYELRACDSASVQLKICANEIDSIKSKALKLAARCYYDNAKYKESIDEFMELKKTDTLELQDLKRVAQAALQIGDTALAVQYYVEAKDRDPSQCKYVYDVGRFIMYVVKDYKLAIDFFKTRLVHCNDSLNQTVNYFIGYGYSIEKQYDSAYVYLKESLKLNPKDLKSHLFLGDVYAGLKKPDSAKVEFEFIIENINGNTETVKFELTQALFKLCGMFLEQKKPNELKKYAQKWVELLPENQYGYLYLAVSYQLNSDTENACKYYKKVLSIDPKNPQAKEMINKLKCP